ncbi:peptidylprolyl isomerase [Spirosoma fluviale]|uniref:Peptidyl-prolyl cis-trans isomerase n=1 Tax=Spirosoma fluviale TaxID=1597977 RepID=A0A286GHA0_9BACT|nr:peptidylprolyl isomerase [Spirosoma fluviale]SOD94888.1 peptidyl-prolyl cis-trans isomerase B (cyclophilin B) [Spirosoma fluviale]
MHKFLLLFLLIPALAIGQNRKKKDYLVSLTTPYGTMRLVLYDQTPKHKENFIKLVNQKFYDSLLFHRVIPMFMIQGGDPKSRRAEADQPLGNGDIGYKVPAEFVPALFHKKGALAAARDGNPEKASSGCQFYVVQGRVWDDAGLQTQVSRIETMKGHMPTEEQTQVYKTLGGSPHLDGNYTVFGEVIDGLAIVDSIAKQPRNEMDRPEKDVRMNMTGEWVKKKKITKQYGYKYM